MSSSIMSNCSCSCSSSSSSLINPPIVLPNLNLNLNHNRNIRLQRRRWQSPPPYADLSCAGNTSISTVLHCRRPRAVVCPASENSSSNYSNYDQEESRWLREEQRWLREEQRWLREEARWNLERQSLLRQISQLTLRIQESTERLNSPPPPPPPVPLLSEPTFLSKISESESSLASSSKQTGRPMVQDPVEQQQQRDHTHMPKRKPLTLRMGSRGQEVQAMQEALLKLGFYSGEEDMEYSSFSSGTERAVKTWQASLGAPEDGIMTAELLERLYAARQIDNSAPLINLKGSGNGIDPSSLKKDEANGAPAASVTEIAEVQQTVVNKGLTTEVELSKQRVFLLGENRWEEPSRLITNDKQSGGIKARDSSTRCLACRGEGRVMCTECDGTGEPNVEPQFLEWIDEGARCPYCEGLGYTICDVCEGRIIV
ncbi:hypothetical protein Ancab_031301 [Ancistrocladus abbreviatus]